MVGRDKVGALVVIALGLGLGCASDPPANDDDRSTTPGIPVPCDDDGGAAAGA